MLIRMVSFWRSAFLTLCAASLASAAAAGGPDSPTFPSANDIPEFSWPALGHALLCLLVAASLGAILAFRPRRAAGPPRVAHVIQTQVMLAIVGSLVMLVVGASLARAFGIAGAASLVRYRAKVDDPKDASVMLSCLAVGLASGVGLFFLAIAGTAFIVAVLWALEFNEAWPAKVFELKVSAKDPAALKPELEALLKRHGIAFELRGSTEKHLSYMAHVPQGKRTDRISEAITNLAGARNVDVDWAEKRGRSGS
jgi:uncharacterized membrane protein YhiD involved in acid resistance